MKRETSYKNSFGDVLFGHEWPVEKPKANLIIVTGMCEHSTRYDDFALFVNKYNISVLCIDHYGQGIGKNGELGRGAKDYFAKMEKTIDELVLKLKKETNLPVYIFAHSMGSFVLQGYIEHYCNADKVVVCGSNFIGPIGKVGSLLANIIVHDKNYNKPAGILNNMSIGAYEKTCKNEDSKNAWISYNKENYKKYDNDPYCGYHCTNGFFKEFLKGLASLNKKENLKRINKKLPILIISGEADAVGKNGKGPTKLNEVYKKYGLNSEVIIYKNMKHEILNEDNRLNVYKDVVNFLK